MSYLIILLGGGVGSLARYIIAKFTNQFFNQLFPVGTLLVNLRGCFLAGFLYTVFERFTVSQNARIFIFTGFLAGFTTFSTFMLETDNLFKDKEMGYGMLNILLNNIGGIILVFLGILLGHLVLKKFG